MGDLPRVIDNRDEWQERVREIHASGHAMIMMSKQDIYMVDHYPIAGRLQTVCNNAKS